MIKALLDQYKQANPSELGENGALRVCVGGGSGFIGSHIAKALMAEVSTLSLYHD